MVWKFHLGGNQGGKPTHNNTSSAAGTPRRVGRVAAAMLLQTWCMVWYGMVDVCDGYLAAEASGSSFGECRSIYAGICIDLCWQLWDAVNAGVRATQFASGGSHHPLHFVSVVIRLWLLPRQYSLLFLSATSVLFVDVY